MIKSSLSANAAIQFLISPGGKTPISSLKRPDEPPSSPTVTTAVMLFVIFLMPLSNIESPVPPPIATIFGPLFNFLLLYNDSNKLPFDFESFTSRIVRFVFCQPLKKQIIPISIIISAIKSVFTCVATFLIISIVKYTGLKLKNIIPPIVINNEPRKISINHLFICNPGISHLASFNNSLSNKFFFIF